MLVMDAGHWGARGRDTCLQIGMIFCMGTAEVCSYPMAKVCQFKVMGRHCQIPVEDLASA